MSPSARRPAFLGPHSLVFAMLWVGLLASRGAHAQPPASLIAPQPGFVGVLLTARVGAAVPFGKLHDGAGALGDAIAASPLGILDAGVRVMPWLYVGAFGQLGGASSKDCPPDVRCSGTHAMVGGRAVLLLTGRRLVPWLGAGLAFERLELKQATPSVSDTTTLLATGPAGVLDLGLDVTIAHRFHVGPYVALTLGRFSRVSVSGSGAVEFEGALHGWLGAGLGARFDL